MWWTTEDAHRIWSPMRDRRLSLRCPLAIAGLEFRRFLTILASTLWIFHAPSKVIQVKQMPRMITSRLRGFVKHVLMHIHALDCTSRRVEGKQLKIITSYVSSPRRSGARFPHQSPPRRAWCASVEFSEPHHLECSRFAASEWSLNMWFLLGVSLFLSLVIILRFTL